MDPRTPVYVLVAALIFTSPAAAAATNNSTAPSDGDESGPVVNINLDDVVDAITDFTSDFTDNLKDILVAVFFTPFRLLAEALLDLLVKVLSTAPRVHPNPAVEEVHHQTLLVSYLLAGLGFVTAGILYIVGPILNVSYRQARLVLPRIVAALIFATISLPLLQLGIDFSNALSTAFSPANLQIQEIFGLSTGLVIVWLIESVLLLAVVVLFILRDIYLLFGAAVSPLLAFMWSLPKVKRYGDTFIAGWFAALLIGPADVLVLRFSLALMEGSGTTALQSVSNWVFGVSSLTLLLIVPYQIWTASQSVVGKAYAVNNAGTSDNSSEDLGLSMEQRRRLRENQRKRQNGSGNGRFDRFRGRFK